MQCSLYFAKFYSTLSSIVTQLKFHGRRVHHLPPHLADVYGLWCHGRSDASTAVTVHICRKHCNLQEKWPLQTRTALELFFFILWSQAAKGAKAALL